MFVDLVNVRQVWKEKLRFLLDSETVQGVLRFAVYDKVDIIGVKM
jgi:hypothetical protein